MHYLRLQGDHYEMGVKRGNICKNCQISFPLKLDDFQREHGKQSEAVLREYFPEVFCSRTNRAGGYGNYQAAFKGRVWFYVSIRQRTGL